MAQFLCLKNIRTFLSTCTSVFELKETDLFQASMLYDYTDFARVLHTLSRLSNCGKAKQSWPELQGFPRSSPTQVVNIKRRTASGSAVTEGPSHQTGLPSSSETTNNVPDVQVVIRTSDCRWHNLNIIYESKIFLKSHTILFLGNSWRGRNLSNFRRSCE